jgi:ParB family chromosome partitioning protein
LQREELTPLERAHALAALKEAFGLSIRDVGDRVGISKSSVQRSLDLLDLPDDLMNALRQGAPESKILELAKISDREERRKLLVSLDSLSREQLREYTGPSKGALSAGSKARNGEVALGPEERRLVEEMQRALGVKVRMKMNTQGGDKGQVIIDFYSHEDLQELFRKVVAD